ncbi:MAG: YjjG family noncanonical pyrimidine nucleotidase [Chlamydiota bacterium]
MKPYQTILFDIDDTLIDFKKSEAISLSKCHDAFYKKSVGFEDFLQDYNKINHALWRLAEENQICASVIGRERFRQVSELYGFTASEAISAFYEEELIENSDWVSGAPSLLDALQANGIRIGFITNGFSHMQKRKYRKLNLAQYSEVLVISEDIGYAKPHPHIFLHALRLSNAQPAHTLMVGDSLTSDGEGARGLAMPFCWYNPDKKPGHPEWQPDFEIADLASLHAIAH